MEIIEYPRMVKARKQHRCDSCGKTIEKGEEYERAVYKNDDMFTWRTCKRCKPYVDEAFNNPDYCFLDGMSEQDFRNYMYEEHKDIAVKWWGRCKK